MEITGNYQDPPKKKKPLVVESANDPRYKKYQDSLLSFKYGEQLKKRFDTDYKEFPFQKEDLEYTDNVGIKLAKKTGILPVKEYVGKYNPKTMSTSYSYGFKKPEQEVIVKPKVIVEKQKRNLSKVNNLIGEGINYGTAEVPEANVKINQSLPEPKFDTSENNTRMNGAGGYGDGRNQKGVYTVDALRAVESAERFNKEIERKYNNPEAQNNPKAQERYQKIKNNVSVIQSQY